MATDVTGQLLEEGSVVQSILDPSVGSYRERGLGVVAEIDPNSDSHVWVSGQIWWDRNGTSDFLRTDLVRTHTSLLFAVAEPGTDAMDLAYAGHPASPSPQRLAVLAGHDQMAADMWDRRTVVWNS